LWIAPAVAKKVNEEPKRLERQEERVGAAGAGDRVPGMAQPSDGGLQLPDLGAHDELLPLDDGLHGRHHGVLDGLVLGDEVQQRNVQ
jgi:hypothetical protein